MQPFETKTDLRAALLYYALILGPVLVVMEAVVWIAFPNGNRLIFALLIAGAMLISYFLCVVSAKGTVQCLPANEVRGARLLIHLRNQNLEVYQVRARDIRFRQTAGERRRNVARVDIPSDHIHLAGVQNAAELHEWIEANMA